MAENETIAPSGSTLYLCAPVNALVEGIYEEKISFSEVKKHGDFGLGTFDHWDGEMILLDGTIYQIASDGRVQKVEEGAMTPFSCVTFYRPVSHDQLDVVLSYDDFLSWVLRLLPSPNLCATLFELKVTLPPSPCAPCQNKKATGPWWILRKNNQCLSFVT